MREILFRARQINDGEWVEGIYMPRPNSPGKSKYYIVSIGSAKWYDVEPETVCQYTGLIDKNGRKIFEGDCLGHKQNVVEYLSGSFVVSGDRPLSMMAKYNEVVGNIFDKE